MLRLCIERLIPRAKDDAVKIAIPDSINSNEFVTNILRSLSGQELSIAELKHAMSITGDSMVYHCHEEDLKHLK